MEPHAHLRKPQALATEADDFKAETKSLEEMPPKEVGTGAGILAKSMREEEIEVAHPYGLLPHSGTLISACLRRASMAILLIMFSKGIPL